MTPYLLIQADARAIPLADQSVHCVVTSPPYWGLRDYGADGQIGLEKSVNAYVESLVGVCREVRRVLRDDGTFWLNLGDSYSSGTKWGGSSGGSKSTVPRRHGKDCDPKRGAMADGQPKHFASGLKPKDLVGVPWRVAFALQADGWYLRQDIIWAKPNPMPESVQDRCTRSHEYIFMLTKKPRYYYDAEAIKERSLTDDPRRPYGSKGAWQIDGRPLNKQHGGEIRLPRGKAATSPRCDGNPWNENNGRGFIPTGSTGRNKRSVWRVSPYPFKGAHFATFPPRLAEPCILAGTSSHGVCPECGSPWRRIVKKIRRATRPGEATKIEGPASHFHISRDPSHLLEANGKNRLDGLVIGNRDPQRHVTEMITTGWRAGCSCEAGEPVPATVMDCFNGAATTGLVATHHGRRYIGLDLNGEYLAMSAERIRAGWQQPKAKNPRKAKPQPTLFVMGAA